MEHHLRDLKSRSNNSVRAILAETISKLNLKCNNKTIMNVKQYGEYCKYFLMTALNQRRKPGEWNNYSFKWEGMTD
eukprot:710595-Ditylum_brightwellii.AAC.1